MAASLARPNDRVHDAATARSRRYSCSTQRSSCGSCRRVGRRGGERGPWEHRSTRRWCSGNQVVTYDGEQNALGERGDDQQAAATTEPGACSMGTEQHSATHGAYRALVGGAGAARGATGDDAQQRELTARLPALAHAAAASSATLAQEEQTGGGDGRTAVRAGRRRRAGRARQTSRGWRAGRTARTAWTSWRRSWLV